MPTLLSMKKLEKHLADFVKNIDNMKIIDIIEDSAV